VGGVAFYRVYRVPGAAFTPTSPKTLVGDNIPGTTTSFVDTEELAHGTVVTYYVEANFDDGAVSRSNFFTVHGGKRRAAGEPRPTVALDPLYNRQAGQGAHGGRPRRPDQRHGLGQPGRIADGRAGEWTAGGHDGPVPLNADGSFTYKSVNGFSGGLITFTYVAKDISPVSARNIP
jgi:hypothetical protein